MKDLKFPELTEKDKKTINSLFTAYLFYSSVPSGREFWCTACGEHFVIKNCKNNLEYYAILGHHNDTAQCPHCKSSVILKSKGKSKSCMNLYEEQRVVFLHNKGKNKVLAQGYECIKRYTYSLLPEPEIFPISRYVLTPGNAIKQSYSSYWNRWSNEKTVREPFFIKSAMCWQHQPDNSYAVIGIEKLSKTFMKYQMLDDYENYMLHCRNFYELKAMSYLCRFAEYPQIEMLQKLGHYDVIKRLVEDNKKSFPLVNWKAQTPAAFFKMTRSEYNQFKELGGSLSLLKIKNILRAEGIDCSISNAGKINRLINRPDPSYYLESTVDIFKTRNISVADGLKYLFKQLNVIDTEFVYIGSFYRDYFDAAREMNYALDERVVLFPKNLKYAHDRTTEVHRAFLEEKRMKELKEKEAAAKEQLMRNDAQYSFTDGKYLIIVPHTVKEIIEEGKKQHHCVGGYAARHMEGTLTICFLRETENPDTPLYTIEMHDKKLTQIQGYGNHTPLTPEANMFFQKWLKWVENGSKRTKAGKPKLKAISKGA